MKKWLLGAALSFALIFALAACSDDDDASGDGDSGDSGDSDRVAELQDEGTVVVGFADEKPYAYEEDGELKGVAVDVATKVLNDMGIDNVEGQLTDFG